MLNGGRKAVTAVGQCENKFRYQKLLNCLAHAKCLLMSCMFTDNLIYRYCHAMHTHSNRHTQTHSDIQIYTCIHRYLLAFKDNTTLSMWQLLELTPCHVLCQKKLTFKGQVTCLDFGLGGILGQFLVEFRVEFWVHR